MPVRHRWQIMVAGWRVVVGQLKGEVEIRRSSWLLGLLESSVNSVRTDGC